MDQPQRAGPHRTSEGTKAAAFVLTTLIAGCGLTFEPGGAPPPPEPVPAEELGPVFEQPGGGPPIECRGVMRDHCIQSGSLRDGTAGMSLDDVERVIVSCELARCDQAGGAYRIDVLLKAGHAQPIGRGVYGDAEQP